MRTKSGCGRGMLGDSMAPGITNWVFQKQTVDIYIYTWIFKRAAISAFSN
jgi:hypothetical protein